MDGNQTTIDVKQDDVLKAVRETSLLADLSISTWGGTQSDKALLNELKKNHGATGDVGRVIKNLMAGVDEPLKRVKGAYMAVRTRHYALTLPLSSGGLRKEGPRLLPTMIAEKYLSEYAQFRGKAHAELNIFLAEYEDLRAKARANLGTMAPALNEYPSVDALKTQFRLHLEISPVPDSGSFAALAGMGLNDAILASMSRKLDERLKAQASTANAEIWKRVAEPLRKLIERLETPLEPGSSARFKDATVENIRELCDLLPGWNVGGDARIDEITDDIKQMLDGVTGSDLRKNEAVRESVAVEARRVSDKLASWGL